MDTKTILGWFKKLDKDVEIEFYYHKFAEGVPKCYIGSISIQWWNEEHGYPGHSTPITKNEDNETYCKEFILEFLNYHGIEYQLKEYEQLSLF